MDEPRETTDGTVSLAFDDLGPVDDYWSVAEDEFPCELPPLPPDPLGPDPFRHEAANRATALAEPPEHDMAAAEALAAVAPGPLLAAHLEGIDPKTVSLYYLVEMIAAFQRMGSWAQARLMDLAGELVARPGINPHHPLPGGKYAADAAAGELAPRLGVSRYTARRLVTNAGTFRHKLDQTADALRQGAIDDGKASTLARLLNDQPADVAWEVQRLVLPGAGQQTVGQLSQAVEKAIIAIDPHRAVQRHRRACDQRRVDHPRHLPDGMAALHAVLPATDAAGLDLALEAAARSAKANGDKRTVDQLRADALALMGHTALDEGYIGTREPMPPPEQGTSGPASPAAEAHDAPESPSLTDGGTTALERHDHDAGPGAEPADDVSTATPEPIEPDRIRTVTPEPPLPTDADERSPSDSREPGPPTRAGNAGGDPPDGQAVSDYLRMLHMPIGTIGGRRAQILVTVPLSVLVLPPESQAGMGALAECLPHLTGAVDPPGDSSAQTTDEAPGTTSPAAPTAEEGPNLAEVAELHGYGPITPDVARALAMSGDTWQRLVTDPLSGELLDVGRTRYRPPAALAEFVRHRDRTCVHPGCTTPAHACQLDHIEPWYPNGTTSAFNLAPECTPHHIAKTIGGFTLRRLPDGVLEWTTPSGHTYLRDHHGRITRAVRPAAADTAPPF